MKTEQPPFKLPVKIEGKNEDSYLVDANGKSVIDQTKGFERKHYKLLQWLANLINATQTKFTYDYARPAMTADVALFRRVGDNGALEVLLILRKSPPFAGHWALPGGFCNENETSCDAAKRELTEETGLEIEDLELVCVADTPNRDPRGWTVSLVYTGFTKTTKAPEGCDDAAEAKWIQVADVPKNLAFDHDILFNKALAQIGCI